MTIDPYRLPRAVRPNEYRITIQPDFEAETFTGSVTIEAVVEPEEHSESPIDSVTLNSDGLSITSATITRGATEEADPLRCDPLVDEELERLTLTPSTAIDPGPITINIEFDGRFDEQLVGLYLSRFTDANGVEQKLATTQFEATHARKCFPCWDEPDFKARFALTLILDEGLTAVTNGPERSRTPLEDGSGKVRIEFEPTMVMSTYLVALVAGPLEITDPVDVDGVPLRVVHIPGKGDLTPFALEAGAFALRYFSEYFGLPYPDQKLDLVAIPDFAFGAMENVGCVTFREVLLLIDPQQATQTELQRAADVINHEIAHMWFGDLVTMKWWNGLWLNEAFATFMEMRCTDAFRPDWQRWTDFGLSRSTALDTDSLATTRPIEYKVISPEDAEGMFDVLTYEKGAAVVRMLEQYLGEERFRDGIRRYMTEHQFGNAETSDLWDAIEAETGEPVRRIMESWIFQGGYPLLSVGAVPDTPENTTDQNGHRPAQMVLSQERMRYAGAGESADQTWAIPIRYRWKPAGAEEPEIGRVLLDGDATELSLADRPEWIIANAEGSSFLRVSYPPELLDALADVAGDSLSSVERFGLIDDTWASVLAGRTSTPSYLNLLEALTIETNRSVWQRIIAGLSQLKRLLDGEAADRLEEIAHDALAPALANLGLAPVPDEDDRQRQLRGDLVRALGTIANDPEIQEESKRTVATGRRNPELVETSLMAAAVDVVAANGDNTDFDDFITSWHEAGTPQEELRYLGALSDFPDPMLASRLHQLILDGDVRSQNAPTLLRRSLFNRDCGRHTWVFITEHWDRLNELFASNLVVRMLEGLTSLDMPSDEASARKFFSENQVPTGGQTLEQILEKQRVMVELRAREADRLGAFILA